MKIISHCFENAEKGEFSYEMVEEIAGLTLEEVKVLAGKIPSQMEIGLTVCYDGTGSWVQRNRKLTASKKADNGSRTRYQNGKITGNIRVTELLLLITFDYHVIIVFGFHGNWKHLVPGKQDAGIRLHRRLILKSER